MMATDLYRKMLTIRLLENRLQELCLIGEGADLHFSKGQEAISVGVCSVLSPTDYIVTHHRTIAHSIAKGVPMKPLVAEVLGKANGVNGGIAGEMHIYYEPVKYMFSFQLVGTCIPVAAGIAWASKYYKKENAVTAVFFGDAATANAQFHEGLNIAAIQKVPLLIVVEDNHLAGNIRPRYYLPENISLADRFNAFGIESMFCDGNKVDDVMLHAKTLAMKVRNLGKPIALICDTTRMSFHKQGMSDIRSADELAELAKRDPLIYEQKRSDISVEEVYEMKVTITKEIEEAIEETRRAPIPELQI